MMHKVIRESSPELFEKALNDFSDSEDVVVRFTQTHVNEFIGGYLFTAVVFYEWSAMKRLELQKLKENKTIVLSPADTKACYTKGCSNERFGKSAYCVECQAMHDTKAGKEVLARIRGDAQ